MDKVERAITILKKRQEQALQKHRFYQNPAQMHPAIAQAYETGKPINPRVGLIVKLRVPCLGNGCNKLGICYEVYATGRGSFIFENGSYDGFGTTDHWMLEEVEMSTDDKHLQYEFRNVTQVTADFKNGLWHGVFKKK